MATARTRPTRARVLIIDDELGQTTTIGRAATTLANALRARDVDVMEARTAAAGLARVESGDAFDAIVIDWRLADDDPATCAGTLRILEAARRLDAHVPIFLTAERADASAIPLAAMQMADEFVWMLEDTPAFLAGRVVAAARRYRQREPQSVSTESSDRAIRRSVLVIDAALASPDSPRGRRVRTLCAELSESGTDVIESLSFDDGHANLISNAHIHVVVVDAALAGLTGAHGGCGDVVRALRERNSRIPVFMLTDGGTEGEQVADVDDEFASCLDCSSPLNADNVTTAADEYLAGLLPPFAKALLAYDREREYSWAAPGHQGGVAFTKSPVGRVFFDFYGEALFRTDMGIERAALGSLLDHSGPIGDSERYAARVFGAHRSYSALNGSSGANRAILSACVGEGEIALIDRNCHKSIAQGLAMSGGIPLYFRPKRNRFGIIGPIDPADLNPAAVDAAIAAQPLASRADSSRPVYAVMTNCTYDGICYDAEWAEELLGQRVDRLHFDEAWYAYARFHPLYAGRFAMRGNPAHHHDRAPTVFATQSTHKLLAALSQAAFIHVRDGRRAIEHGRFNEAYGLQASTSPLYPIIAANEVAAAMMDGRGGFALTHDAIREAVAFRQAVARLQVEWAERGEWFFGPWNAPTVPVGDRGAMPFHLAPEEWLASSAECWRLRSDEAWHGFGTIPDGWCLLDPTKVGIVCPGMSDDGTLSPDAIPADLVTAYLTRHAIVPSRTTDHMVLFLFTIGVTKGKWGTLVNALLDFKRDYDSNALLTDVLPAIAASAPTRYAGLGLRDLAREMSAQLIQSRQGYWQARACAELPTPVVTPRRAFQRLMAGDADLVPLSQMADRVSAVGLLPYPPGIPVVMPGESVGPDDGPWLSYLRALQVWGARFPGFAKEVEGTGHENGEYVAYCLK